MVLVLSSGAKKEGNEDVQRETVIHKTESRVLRVSVHAAAATMVGVTESFWRAKRGWARPTKRAIIDTRIFCGSSTWISFLRSRLLPTTLFSNTMPKKTPQWSTIVPNTGRADRGDIRRSWNPVLHPELGMEGCQTLYEAFRRGHRLNPLGPCMGFRATSTTGMATPFIYSSYTECLARIHAVAAGLETMDLVEANDEGLILLGLYMKNCMEWSIGEHAVYCLRGATVPFYDTLGPETVSFILEQTETKSVVCTRAEVGKLCQAKNSGKCPKFQAIIVVNGVTPEVAQLASEAGVQIHSFAKVEAVGARRIATQGHTHRPPVGKDIATFCYTSGTTGNPKGALLTHENLLSAAGGIQRSIPTVAMLPTDRHLSYLPLPHIFERCVITQAYIGGASVAFFRGDPTLLIEDFQACRPTLMAVAPRVLNKIYDKVSVWSATYLYGCVMQVLTLCRFMLVSMLPVEQRRRSLMRPWQPSVKD